MASLWAKPYHATMISRPSSAARLQWWCRALSDLASGSPRQLCLLAFAQQHPSADTPPRARSRDRLLLRLAQWGVADLLYLSLKPLDASLAAGYRPAPFEAAASRGALEKTLAFSLFMLGLLWQIPAELRLILLIPVLGLGSLVVVARQLQHRSRAVRAAREAQWLQQVLHAESLADTQDDPATLADWFVRVGIPARIATPLAQNCSQDLTVFWALEKQIRLQVFAPVASVPYWQWLQESACIVGVSACVWAFAALSLPMMLGLVTGLLGVWALSVRPSGWRPTAIALIALALGLGLGYAV